MTDLTTKTKRIPETEGEQIKRGPSVRKAREFGGFDVLSESAIIREFVKDSGQYVLLPKGTRLLNAVSRLLVEEMADPLGFEEVTLPKIAPVETFRKAGVLGKWDDYLVAVVPYSTTKGVTEQYIMDPLQCTALYQFLENRALAASDLPMLVFDRSGPTYRNEDQDKIVPLVKQREFHRAEFVYVATREQAIQIREECLARLEKICAMLGLSYRIVVGSGCFQLKKGELQTPQTVEEIPIKDLEIYCPDYKNVGAFLEIAGCAVLATILTSRFNIRGQDGTELWSGCTGIGLERLMFALLKNYGSDFDKFPTKIQEMMT